MKNKSKNENEITEPQLFSDSSDDESTGELKNDDEGDVDFLTAPAHTQVTELPTVSTRSKSPTSDKIIAPSFKLQCRSGFRTMNPDLMVALGLMVSKFGVSENKAAECLQMIANSLFGQSLKLPSEEVVKEEERVADDGEEDEEEREESTEPKRKKRKPFGDLSSTLPSPRTIHRWI